MAKASGFSSVTELLDVKGSQNVSHDENLKEIDASPRKQKAPKEVIAVLCLYL